VEADPTFLRAQSVSVSICSRHDVVGGCNHRDKETLIVHLVEMKYRAIALWGKQTLDHAETMLSLRTVGDDAIEVCNTVHHVSPSHFFAQNVSLLTLSQLSPGLLVGLEMTDAEGACILRRVEIHLDWLERGNTR
jgi:hypothetical protein